MSLTEALGEGVQVTVVGLCIVFAVLIILMLVMMAMKAIFYKEAPVTAGGPNVSQKPEPIAMTPATPPASRQMTDDELIAVLTAAVAASLNTSTYHLQVKSFRRIENTSPSWNKAGVRDVIESRF